MKAYSDVIIRIFLILSIGLGEMAIIKEKQANNTTCFSFCFVFVKDITVFQHKGLKAETWMGATHIIQKSETSSGMCRKSSLITTVFEPLLPT